jgi:hypothetical protein
VGSEVDVGEGVNVPVAGIVGVSVGRSVEVGVVVEVGSEMAVGSMVGEGVSSVGRDEKAWDGVGVGLTTGKNETRKPGMDRHNPLWHKR